MYFSAQDLDAALPLIEKYEEHLVAIGEVTYCCLKGRCRSVDYEYHKLLKKKEVKKPFLRWGSILRPGL